MEFLPVVSPSRVPEIVLFLFDLHSQMLGEVFMSAWHHMISVHDVTYT